MALYFDLLEKIQMGDEQSVKVLWLEFEPAIKNLCRTLHYEMALADLKIIFMEFVTGMDIQKFRMSSDEQIASYIHKELRNKAITKAKQYRTKNKPAKEISSGLLISQKTPDLADSIFKSKAFHSLTARQQKVLVGKYLGYSNREIGQQLGGKTPQAVSGLKRRAKRKLEKLRATETESE